VSTKQVKAAKSTKSGKPAPRQLPGLSVQDGFIQHPFDAKFGVRTSGLIAGRHLRTGSRSERHATAYYAVAPSIFNSMLERWRRCRSVAPLDAYTFVDLGAGMGRAMLLASEHPFRAVLGVEFHPTLARIARKNLADWRVAGRTLATTRLYCRDAVDLPLPSGHCVVFLFNPFGAPVLRRLLARWRRSLVGREGQIDILYVNNEQDRVFRMEAGFVRLFYGPVRRSPADLAADRNILIHQPGAEYVATGWEDCAIYRWMGDKTG
jgi:hypothetical protein